VYSLLLEMIMKKKMSDYASLSSWQVISVESAERQHFRDEWTIIIQVVAPGGARHRLYTTTSFSPSDPMCACRICDDFVAEVINGAKGQRGSAHWMVNLDSDQVSKAEARCPICGSPGDDLVFRFYCSSTACINYHS